MVSGAPLGAPVLPLRGDVEQVDLLEVPRGSLGSRRDATEVLGEQQPADLPGEQGLAEPGGQGVAHGSPDRNWEAIQGGLVLNP